jgi:hypothetical protein
MSKSCGRGIVVWVLLVAGAARAQGSNPALLAETRRLRGEIERALALKFFGLANASKQSNVDQMEAILSAVHPQFTPALEAGDASVYRSVAEKLAEADGWLANMKAAIACGTAIEKVKALHAQDRQAPDEDVAALEEAQHVFDRVARNPVGELRYANWDGVALQCRSAASALVAANPRVVEEAAQRKAAAEHAAAARELASVTGPADRALAPLLEAEKRGEPAGEDALKAVEETLPAVRAISPPLADYYLREVTFLRVYGWLGAGDAKHIAEALSAKPVAAGRSTGKKLQVGFAAKPGHCYLLLGDFASRGGSEKIDGFQLTVKGGLTHELELEREWPAIASGLCASESASATATASLAFPGTRNGVQYVVLDWPRDGFPLSVASQMHLVLRDHCDLKAREDLFSAPIPGTLAYEGSEPRILVRTRRDGYADVLGIGATGSTGANVRELSSQPGGKIAVRSAFTWQECPYHEKAQATSPISIKLHECEDRINKKYQREYDQVERLRDQARKMGGISPAAEKMKGRLDDSYDRDFNASCGAALADAKKRAEASFNKLVDHFADVTAPPRDPLDRIAFAQAIAPDASRPSAKPARPTRRR